MDWLIDGLKWVSDNIAKVVNDTVAGIGEALIGKEGIENLHNQVELESVKNGTNSKFDNYGKTEVIDWMHNGTTTRTPVEEIEPGLKDMTGANEEIKIGETVAPSSGDNWQRYVDQVEEWRQEDFARDDTKYQRQVKDMRAAGINPNLALGALGGSTAGSTSITAPPNTELEAELNEKLTLMQQFIDNEFKADENQKDRFTDLLGGIVNIFLAKKLFK